MTKDISDETDTLCEADKVNNMLAVLKLLLDDKEECASLKGLHIILEDIVPLEQVKNKVVAFLQTRDLFGERFTELACNFSCGNYVITTAQSPTEDITMFVMGHKTHMACMATGSAYTHITCGLSAEEAIPYEGSDVKLRELSHRQLAPVRKILEQRHPEGSKLRILVFVPINVDLKAFADVVGMACEGQSCVTDPFQTTLFGELGSVTYFANSETVFKYVDRGIDVVIDCHFAEAGPKTVFDCQAPVVRITFEPDLPNKEEDQTSMAEGLSGDIPDSGKAKRTFPGGFQRDNADDKDRWSLLPPSVWETLIPEVGHYYGAFLMDGDEAHLECALLHLTEKYGIMPMAHRFKKGAEKWGPFNWASMGPMSNYIDSIGRHLYATTDVGKKHLTEPDPESLLDHIGATMWNTAALMHVIYMSAAGFVNDSFMDIPRYEDLAKKSL